MKGYQYTVQLYGTHHAFMDEFLTFCSDHEVNVITYEIHDRCP